MSRHLYCCPICGNSSLKDYEMIRCKKCDTHCDNPIISKYPIEHYQEEAKRRFPKSEDGLFHGTKGGRRFEEILLEEISQNPQFDKEKCMKWIEEENAEYDKQRSDQAKGIQPTPVVTSTPQPINTPKCPVCGSTQLKKISVAKRGLHAWAFGIFSKTAFSQFKCESCGYKF